MIQQTDTAKIFKALCDPQRVAIVEHLRDSNKCACELTEHFNMAQSKLSYHMKVLCESGLVECWYEGKWTHYRLSSQGCKNAQDILYNLTNQK